MAYNAPTTEVDPVHVLAQAGWPAPRSLQRIEGGWITLIWRFETADGKAHGLRLYRPGEGIDEQARRESLTIQALRGAGLPAPELEASGVYDGCPYFVMTWLRGKQLVQIMEKQLWRLWPLALEFGRLQARLHRLAPDDLRYPDAGWSSIENEPELSAAVKAAAREDALCHFDYHPLNVLADAKGITGIIDFSQTGVADRRADLGRTLSVLTAGPIPPGPLKPVLQVMRGQFAAFWRRGYKAEAGFFDLPPLYEAWGAATFVKDIEEAVAEGRGWATPADIARIKAYLADRKRAAGLLGDRPPPQAPPPTPAVRAPE
jgi:aminoglycoside phosphotransferase (APT) family kinase protein